MITHHYKENDQNDAFIVEIDTKDLKNGKNLYFVFAFQKTFTR